MKPTQDELRDALREAANDFFSESEGCDLQIADLTTKDELAKGVTTVVTRRRNPQ